MQWYPMSTMCIPGGANWGPCHNQAGGNTQAWREPEGYIRYEGGPAPNNTNATQEMCVVHGQITTLRTGDMARGHLVKPNSDRAQAQQVNPITQTKDIYNVNQMSSQGEMI